MAAERLPYRAVSAYQWAMTASAAAERPFELFVQRLRPDAAEMAAARHAAGAVAAVLRRHFRPGAAARRDDHLIAGSFGKRTAIRPLPAVDLYYLLPETACIGGPPSCAEALRQTAAALGGGVGDPDGWRILAGGVAAIPCVERGGAFLIPGETGWRISNPAAETAALRLADSLSEGRLGRLLALLKAWRRAVGAPVSALGLELLARDYVGAVQPAPLPRLFGDFFAWARRHTPARLELPGGMEHLAIGDGWHGPAEAAYWRCVLAGRHAAAGEWPAATAEWRKVLGADFPGQEEER